MDNTYNRESACDVSTQRVGKLVSPLNLRVNLHPITWYYANLWYDGSFRLASRRVSDIAGRLQTVSSIICNRRTNEHTVNND